MSALGLPVARIGRTAISAASKRLAAAPAIRPVIRAHLTASRAFASPVAGPSRQRCYATSVSAASSATDPAEDKAQDLLELASSSLEMGDVKGAKILYQQSLEVKPSSTAWFNLGVCGYQLKQPAAAIEAWQKSIDLSPSPDAYTNLASAYILSRPPQPALAIKNLTKALELAPEDPEIAFNLAAVLESTDKLEMALQMYKKAQAGGIERAAQNIRNVSAKLLGMKAKAEGAGDASA